MGIWRQFAEYLFIKKHDPKDKLTQSEKYMHGMNRIALYMFLFAIILMLVKLVIIPLMHK